MKHPELITLTTLTMALAGALALPIRAAEQAVTTDIGTIDRAVAEQAFQKPSYSPYAGRNFPTRPFFGDTHLHTAYSMDAGAFGCRIAPKEAYRLARGDTSPIWYTPAK